MTKIINKYTIFLLLITFLKPITVQEIEKKIIGNNYPISGIIYKSSSTIMLKTKDILYELKGYKPSTNNVFGWKAITSIPLSNPQSYLVYLGDIDNNKDTKFDWLLIDTLIGNIKKIEGINSQKYFSLSPAFSDTSFMVHKETNITFYNSSLGAGSILNEGGYSFGDFPKFDDYNESNKSNVEPSKKEDNVSKDANSSSQDGESEKQKEEEKKKKEAEEKKKEEEKKKKEEDDDRPPSFINKRIIYEI